MAPTAQKSSLPSPAAIIPSASVIVKKAGAVEEVAERGAKATESEIRGLLLKEI